MFDYSNDQEFKAFCVQKLTQLSERTEGLSDLKTKVTVLETEVNDMRASMSDQKFWTNVKTVAGPFMVVLHVFAHKLGMKL